MEAPQQAPTALVFEFPANENAVPLENPKKSPVPLGRAKTVASKLNNKYSREMRKTIHLHSGARSDPTGKRPFVRSAFLAHFSRTIDLESFLPQDLKLGREIYNLFINLNFDQLEACYDLVDNVGKAFVLAWLCVAMPGVRIEKQMASVLPRFLYGFLALDTLPEKLRIRVAFLSLVPSKLSLMELGTLLAEELHTFCGVPMFEDMPWHMGNYLWLCCKETAKTKKIKVVIPEEEIRKDDLVVESYLNAREKANKTLRWFSTWSWKREMAKLLNLPVDEKDSQSSPVPMVSQSRSRDLSPTRSK